MGLLAAVITIAMGQPIVGIAIGVAAIALFVAIGARRVARIQIDEAGNFSLPGTLDRLDWANLTLLEVDTDIRSGATGSTVRPEPHCACGCVADRKPITLARGPLAPVGQGRMPHLFQLDRWLHDHARAAGFTIFPQVPPDSLRSSIERGKERWSARRA